MTKMNQPLLLSIVVPCYQEQEALPIFYEEITKILTAIDAPFELLFVNDGSKDDTLSILRDLALKDSHVRYISFSRNFGKEAAMYAGLSHAKGDYTAVMDADLQDPPSLLHQMLDILKSGEYDCVATRRKDRTNEPPIRSWFARRFYQIINSVSDADIQDGARDFRLMNRKMVDAIVSMKEHNRFSKGIFGWVGFRTYWLSYNNIERVAGQTKWNFWKLFRYAIDGIINFSEAPLMIASWLGICLTFFSALALLFFVIRRIAFGDPVAGWASTICVIIIIGGVQLFSTGIVGMYISKIFAQVKQRPHYIIAESNDIDLE